MERIARVAREGQEAVRRVKAGESFTANGDSPQSRKIFTPDEKGFAHGENLYQAHFDLAARAAEESAVLLKNDGGGTLPLSSFAHTVFIGGMAKTPRCQGAGSSHINPWKLHNPLDVCSDVSYAAGYREDGSTDDAMIREAAAAAEQAESTVIFAGLPASRESEGFDRESMELPEGMNRLIRHVSEALRTKSEKERSGRKLIVILYSGSAVELPWADEVDAILYMGLPGEAGADGMLTIGRVSMSGTGITRQPAYP